MLPEGVPITMPTGRPEPVGVGFTNWEQNIADAASEDDEALDAASVGGLRVEVLRKLAALPATADHPSENVRAAVYQLTAETVRTVAELAKLRPRRAVLWNQELDLAAFLGRTLLLADHVLYPDRVFEAIIRNGTSIELKRAAEKELRNAQLLAAGIAIPVPPGVAMAAQGRTAIDLTREDLAKTALVTWVRQQLILEGPTAREALFVRAIDDLATEPSKLWLHGHIDRTTLDPSSGRFGTKMLQPYDPDYNYEPWIKQVRDSAVSAFVQRTNERVVAADVFGAEYVSASLFEARLLRTRTRATRIRPAQAALWADIPELSDLSSPELTKILRNEDAIEDLRRQVRASLATARDDAASIDALTGLTHELEAASHKLQRTAKSDRAWQAAIPAGLSTASMIVGGVTGGLAGLGGALGALAGLAPYLSARMANRREAAYLFVAARRFRK
jgi:hypothetical protein